MNEVNEINDLIQTAHTTYQTWKQTGLAERERLLLKLAELLVMRKRELAEIIVAEIGTPISQAESEIEKCALLAQYYEGKLKGCLCEEFVMTENPMMYYQPEPLGVILGIHPWNFPFWMALRFIIPTALAGNAVVFKHASLVPRSAAAIQQLFIDAGFPTGLVTWLNLKGSEMEPVIANPLVRGVNFAGGTEAGSSVAGLAGKYIKKSVLELGGSDAAIVLPDADLALAVKELVAARLRNAGQACNSPKRILVHQSIYDAFLDAAAPLIQSYMVSDPSLPETRLGPLATAEVKSKVAQQVQSAVASGARLITQGTIAGVNEQPTPVQPSGTASGALVEKDVHNVHKNLQASANHHPDALLVAKIAEDVPLDRAYPATLLADIQPGMAAWDEEVFGPVVAVGKFSDTAEAVSLANNSQFGLGVSVWTQNPTAHKDLIPQLEAGNVYFNMPVRSDPKLPFGGVKNSGYGRELGRPGLLEFTNTKSVVIKP
jgi:succinate-semialdehyde dehydrogenase / glutarate-semialdehyde dehydrogenase